MQVEFSESLSEDSEYNRDNLSWNAWGAPDRNPYDAASARIAVEAVASYMGPARVILQAVKVVDLEMRNKAPARIGYIQQKALERIAGMSCLRTDLRERIQHSVGRSYTDLLRLKRNGAIRCVDAVVYPKNEGIVLKILEWCVKNRIAVIPYGGGSSVTGALEVSANKGTRTISLDMSRMNEIRSIDRHSMLASIDAGIYGPPLERSLNAKGYTLGHFPQSFEYSTLGGWIAARGVGHLSERYGRIEDMVCNLRMATPSGMIETLRVPEQASGSNIEGFATGSEGTLGVITNAIMRIRHMPEHSCSFAALFPDFFTGFDFMRQAAQARLPRSMIRLFDDEETSMMGILSRAMHAPSALRKKTGIWRDKILSMLGYANVRCLVLISIEGDRRETDSGELMLRHLIRKCGGMYTGESLADRWNQNRYATPYLRDTLMEYGIGAETLETSASYDRLPALHQSLREAIAHVEPSSIAMAHLCHARPDGAALYFTILFNIDARNPLQQWQRIKKASLRVILNGGGAISHHHGIGLDHLEAFRHQTDPLLRSAMIDMKTRFDPRGIMNPGKIPG